MKASKSVLWLSATIVILAGCAAGVGLFLDTGGSQVQFLTAHGTTVTLNGSGLYRFDTPIGALGFRGADIVTLFLAVPLLIVSAVLHARGSLRAGLFLSGVLAYLVYNYASLSFGAAYNSLFIVYVAILGAGLFALAGSLLSFDAQRIASRFLPEKPARGAGVFLVVCGAIILLIWLALSIIPALLAGTVAAEAQYYTTFITGALDVAIVGPVLLVTGALVLRRRPLGYLLAPGLLVFSSIIGVNLAAGGALQLAAGAITPGQAGAFTVPFVVLTLVAGVFSVRVFGRLRSEVGK